MNLAAARRTALAAQGFYAAPVASVSMRQVQRVLDQVAQFQIDSVNVLERAHFFPLFSRLGPYDTSLLERATSTSPRRMFEYLGHAASLLDVRLEPSLRFRMESAHRNAWSGILRIRESHPELVEWVLAQVAERGPVTSRELGWQEDLTREHWGWNWSKAKTVLEWLWWKGDISPAFRNVAFERAYRLRRDVIPAQIYDQPTPTEPEARLTLTRRAAEALGIGSVRCLADYFRQSIAATRAAIATLESTGELVPTTVRGWDEPTWRWHASKTPRSEPVRALVSPFDSLVFERQRLERFFGQHYRIEIYTPAAQRRYGYYVYLFVRGSEIAALVDLKADRRSSTLWIQAAWRGESTSAADADIARDLAEELHNVARWQKLDRLNVRSVGDLAADLGRYV